MTERRFTLSVRAEGSADNPSLVGYASVFNSRSKKIPTRAGGFFYEKVSPGAFKRAIAKGNTIANLHHDMTKPLGTQRAGTLQLSEDSRGLLVRCAINPEVSFARDAWHMAQSRSLSSMSFAFLPEEDTWEDYEDEDGERCQLRTLRSIDPLMDVAFLTEGQGAYDAACCDARQLFPDGTPDNIEVRSAGRIYVVDNSPSEAEIRTRLANVRLF